MIGNQRHFIVNMSKFVVRIMSADGLAPLYTSRKTDDKVQVGIRMGLAIEGIVVLQVDKWSKTMRTTDDNVTWLIWHGMVNAFVLLLS